MKDLFGGAFAGKSAFVTGHTGFKGSWLSLWLAALGARVTGYALDPPTEPSLFADAKVAKVLAADLRGDVRDAPRLAAALAGARPEFVLHLAAQPLVRASYEDPAGTFAVNLAGAVNLLEAVRRVPSVRACLVVTTDKCYENREWPYAYREEDALGGHDPYSASKACAEIAVGAYRRSFFHLAGGAALASARAGNVVGGGDWAADRLVPDCVRALSRGEAAVIRNPGSVRPWQHVLEPLSGYLQLAERLAEDPALAGPWNFGPLATDHLTVGGIAGRVVELWGEGSWKAPSTPRAAPAPHEAGVLRLDWTKAGTILGWRPAWGIDEALSATVEWYRTRHRDKGADLAALCRGQIAAYAARAKELGLPWAGGAR